MSDWWEGVLSCPVCGAPLRREGKSLYCGGERRHTFDLSAKGYVNLASAKSTGGGDDDTLILARTAFLEKGFYAPFAQRIADLLAEYAPNGVVVDAGCGEGYYTARMAAEGMKVIGVDLSKRGIKSAASRGKREGLSALFAVAGIYRLPLLSHTADAVVSLFAPIAEEEFLRVLKKGGVFITAGAGPDHLLPLKQVLYDTPRKNGPRADLPTNMTEIKTELLRFEMQLEKEDIEHLFSMTPYYYRTPESGRKRLLSLSSLSCLAEMEIRVYRAQ